MFYIDGLATLFLFGGVYAAGTFGMSEREVLVFGIALNVSAGIGAAAFSWLDDALGSRRTILSSLAGLIVTSGAALLVESATLFWVLGFLLGLFVGPLLIIGFVLMLRTPEAHAPVDRSR
jgi:UMF1 family MFS transporter